MLTGATAVFSSVPAVFIDPFALAGCQMEGMCGYVAVTYTGGRAMCDLLFLFGHTIDRIGRITPDYRLLVSDEDARDSIAASRSEPGTTVSLFQAQREAMDRFAATFTVEPTLKLLLGTLSRRQVHDLLSRSGCRHAILEFLNPSLSPPRIHQVEFTSGHAYPDTPRGFRSGRLFLYDISPSALPKGRLAGLSHLSPPHEAPERTPYHLPAPAPPPAERREATGADAADAELQLFPPLPVARSAGTMEAAQAAASVAGPRHPAPDPEFSRPFERLYRAFRTISADHVGARSEELFTGALRHAQRSRPEFDPSKIGPEDVALLIGMLEAIVAEAPLLRRGRFRSAARGALAEFYDRHYDLLERNRVLDPIQALYSKLSS
jgi:hypothetical protein